MFGHNKFSRAAAFLLALWIVINLATGVASSTSLATPSPHKIHLDDNSISYFNDVGDDRKSSCGKYEDTSLTVYQCELGDLVAQNWQHNTCNWHASNFAASECSHGFENALEETIEQASAGTIQLREPVQQGILWGNVLGLQISLNYERYLVPMILRKHAPAAIRTALNAWQPVFARYHHGDRGVCIEVFYSVSDDADNVEGRPLSITCTPH
jgi:hypothetical protein